MTKTIKQQAQEILAQIEAQGIAPGEPTLDFVFGPRRNKPLQEKPADPNVMPGDTWDRGQKDARYSTKPVWVK